MRIFMMKYLAPLALIVLVSACVSQTAQNQTPEEQQPGMKVFKVIIGHTFYSPNTFAVSRGDTVRFFANSAKGTGIESGFSHNHGMTIDEYGINAAVNSEDQSSPVIIEFLADKAGEFEIYCKTCLDGPFGANHPAIKAKLIVTEQQ